MPVCRSFANAFTSGSNHHAILSTTRLIDSIGFWRWSMTPKLIYLSDGAKANADPDFGAIERVQYAGQKLAFGFSGNSSTVG